MKQNFASDVLYHLVGFRRPDDDDANFDILCTILKSMELRTNEVGGQRGGSTTRRDPNRPVIKGEPAEQTVVCLCDIPFDSLPFHARRYGRFGVGVSRSVVAQWGTRPAIYIPTSKRGYGCWGNRFADEVKTVLSGLDHFFPDTPAIRSRPAGSPATDAQDAVDEASTLISRDLQSFIKLWDVDLPDGHPENFYLEREWRKLANLPLAPSLREIVAPQKYHDELKAIIASLEVGNRYSITGPISYMELPETF